MLLFILEYYLFITHFFLPPSFVQDHDARLSSLHCFPKLSPDDRDFRPNVSTCDHQKPIKASAAHNELTIATAQNAQLIADHMNSQDGLHPLPTSIASALSRQISHCPAPDSSYCLTRMVAPTQTPPLPCNGVMVEPEDDLAGESLLHLAARMNAGHQIAFSIHSVDAHNQPQTDKYGRTALTSAAAADALETAGALYQLEKGSSMTGSARVQPPSGTTITTTTTNNNNIGQSLPRPRRRQRAAEVRQFTPLIAAVQTGSEQLAHYLIDEGHSLTGVDDYGRNVVHWAAATNSVALLQRLAKCKPFSRLLNARDDYERTPLMLAIREGNEAVVRLLLAHKANLFPLDYSENDPLKLARDRGFVEIETILCDAYSKLAQTIDVDKSGMEHAQLGSSSIHEQEEVSCTDSQESATDYDALVKDNDPRVKFDESVLHDCERYSGQQVTSNYDGRFCM